MQKTHPIQQTSKRCKFFVACGNKSSTSRWHHFLKKKCDVCQQCADTNEYLEISSFTPNGAKFTVSPFRLEWHPFDGVASIIVPLRAKAPLLAIAEEITRNGAVSEQTRKLWFNT